MGTWRVVPRKRRPDERGGQSSGGAAAGTLGSGGGLATECPATTTETRPTPASGTPVAALCEAVGPCASPLLLTRGCRKATADVTMPCAARGGIAVWPAVEGRSVVTVLRFGCCRCSSVGGAWRPASLLLPPSARPGRCVLVPSGWGSTAALHPLLGVACRRPSLPGRRVPSPVALRHGGCHHPAATGPACVSSLYVCQVLGAALVAGATANSDVAACVWRCRGWRTGRAARRAPRPGTTGGAGRVVLLWGVRFCLSPREVPCRAAPVPRPTVFAAARRVSAPCRLATIAVRLDRLPAVAVVAPAARHPVCPRLWVYPAGGPTRRPPSALMRSRVAAPVRPVHWSTCALDVDGGGRRGGVSVVGPG
eukprot:TRINITY_DN5433_c0_g1_i1.p1 TRINITY_DN5433_c0_g1~~TRINITY_DN5433_c0_g1_i1.p1  ORF type:complete len:366 (-),score=20.76 TRINITY_DN5433_c0_g1_i1:1433-2530(-)